MNKVNRQIQKWNCMELKKPRKSGKYLCSCYSLKNGDWVEILKWNGKQFDMEKANRSHAFVTAWMKLPDVYLGVFENGQWMTEYEEFT